MDRLVKEFTEIPMHPSNFNRNNVSSLRQAWCSLVNLPQKTNKPHPDGKERGQGKQQKHIKKWRVTATMRDRVQWHGDWSDPGGGGGYFSNVNRRMPVVRQADLVAPTRSSGYSDSERKVSRWLRPQSPVVKGHTGRGIDYAYKQKAAVNYHNFPCRLRHRRSMKCWTTTPRFYSICLPRQLQVIHAKILGK
jgi:hypothetical protein